jgi:dienelactone hydrolase
LFLSQTLIALPSGKKWRQFRQLRQSHLAGRRADWRDGSKKRNAQRSTADRVAAQPSPCFTMMNSLCRNSIVPPPEEVLIPAGGVWLHGQLCVPRNARAIVLFAHGSGSSRLSPRNQRVAAVLQEAGIATLLFDLLTQQEEEEDDITRELRFDIPFLADRLTAVAQWVKQLPTTAGLTMGFFGASTGAAAALVSAAKMGPDISAVVSRGGRPDLAGPALRSVECPTLLIIGGQDDGVIDLNRQAYAQMSGIKDLHIIPGATHLFAEPGALEEVSRLSAEWFSRWLCKSS